MPNTSEPRVQALIDSLRRQPLLVVQRAQQPWDLRPVLSRLQSMGVRHVELAWSEHPEWSSQCRALMGEFPAIRFGAASLLTPKSLHGVVDAGLGFGVSPVLDAQMLALAHELDLILVPGVMTPSEVQRARELGCSMLKLFPAATLGAAYWQRLSGPLGPLPFCIAAGGLGPRDLQPWLTAGVDAVAIGGSLGADQPAEQSWSQLASWLQAQSD